MRNVFVHYKDNTYHVIDKATDQLFAKVDDVLLINALYKRHKTIKGWHGILSEEINREVIKLLNSKSLKLIFVPKAYYPRYETDEYFPVKQTAFLRLKDGIQTCYNAGLDKVNPAKYLTEWVSRPVEDELVTQAMIAQINQALGTITITTADIMNQTITIDDGEGQITRIT